MLWYNDKISLRQLQTLIIINIFGTGVVLLPRLTVQMAEQDGWLLVAAATFFALICTYIITSLGRMYPTKSFYEYTSLIVSSPVATVLSIGLVIRLVLHIGLTLRVSLEIISQTMLPTTPLWLVAILLVLVSGYGASKGYETRARLGELLIFLVLTPVLLVFAIAAFNVDYTNVMPIFHSSPTTIVRGGFFTLNAFIGIELLLFVHPYISNPDLVRKRAFYSVLVLGCIMTAITLITIARFGIFSIPNQMWPVIQMMDSTNLPGSFIQRQGVLVMSFFIISVFAIVNACLFFSSLVLRSITRDGTHGRYVAVCMAVSFAVCLVPQNMMQVYRYMDQVFLTFGLAYMLIIPLALLVMAKFDKMPWAKVMLILLMGACSLVLVGCDKKEMEERAYVVTLGIDSAEQGYLLTVIEAQQEKENNAGEGDKPQEPVTSTAGTIPEALANANLRGRKSIYLGITETIVLGQGIVESEEKFRHTIDTLNRSLELSKDVYLLTAQETAKDMTEKLPEGKLSSNLHKSSHNTLNQLRQKTLEETSKHLYRTEGALIPMLGEEGNSIDGLAIIEKYEATSVLPQEYIQGYLHAMGQGVGYTLTQKLGESQAVLSITDIKRNISFKEEVAHLDLELRGVVEGYNLSGLEEQQLEYLAAAYGRDVERQVMEAYNMLDYDMDPLCLREDMRKRAPKLYSKGGEVHLSVSANVKISGVGY